MHSSRLAILLAAVPATVFASPPDPSNLPADQDDQIQRIVQGSVTSDWPATAALMGGNEAFCTGTLIAPRAVLTAAHCLEDGAPDTVYFGEQPGAQGEEVPVDRAVIHDGYNSATDEQYFDIGLVFLAADAAPAPIPVDIGDAARLVGQTITYVGFGETQGTGGDGYKKEATAEIVEVQGDILDVQPDGGSACYGDSGGPLYFTDGGTTTVVGVVSFGYTDDCMDLGGNTRVDLYLSWIEDQVDGLERPDDGPADPDEDPDEDPDDVADDVAADDDDAGDDDDAADDDDAVDNDGEALIESFLCTDAEWTADPIFCDRLEGRLRPDASGDGCSMAAGSSGLLMLVPWLARRRRSRGEAVDR